MSPSKIVLSGGYSFWPVNILAAVLSLFTREKSSLIECMLERTCRSQVSHSAGATDTVESHEVTTWTD